MGGTFSEKFLAKKSGAQSVRTGEIVTVRPDYVMSHDNAAAISKTFGSIGVARVLRPESVVIILDHCSPAATEQYALNHKQVREFVSKQGIKNFFDVNFGVCHQVFVEQGFAAPGALVLGSDSHTNSYGAFGAFAAAIGRSEAAVAWATGGMWLRVPETIKVVLDGRPGDGVTPKDLILHVIGKLGADGALYKAVEFCGEAVSGMSVGGRMVLCNMSAEMGAKAGYVEPDQKTFDWLKGRARAGFDPVRSDPDAVFESVVRFDCGGIAPCVAKPHSVDNVGPVSDAKGVKVNQAVIGTCTNGRLEDLEAACRILKGRTVHKGVRLLVFPASSEVLRAALRAGVIEKLAEAGGIIMNPNCGPCLGAHEGALAPGEVCVSSSNRNFKGRMGCNEAEIYLASPLTVAASAVAGEIVDPREYL